MVIIYRKGNTHQIRGIECEKSMVDALELDQYLSDGWVVRPEDLIKYEEPEETNDTPEDEEQVELEEPKKITKEEIDTNGSGKLSNKEIRAAAMRIGIEDWSKARISTLKEKLGI
jgi:hypothetical protein